MITITIHTENEAFFDDTAEEVARILENLARSYRVNGIHPADLRDINGNVVGKADEVEE